MGFLGFDSNSSSTTDKRQAVTDSGIAGQDSAAVARDNGLAIRGGINQITGANGLSLGTNANYLAPQSAQLSNVRAGGNLVVNTSDPTVLQAAIAAMASNSKTVASTISDVAAQSAASNSAAFNDALNQVAALATTQATGGASVAASSIKQILLWGLAIVGVVVIAVMWRKKK